VSEDEARKATEEEVEAHLRPHMNDEPEDEQRKEDEDDVEAHMRKSAPKKF
jgi:hypothetical protein